MIPEPVDVELFDAARHAPLPQMASDKRFKFLSVASFFLVSVRWSWISAYPSSFCR